MFINVRIIGNGTRVMFINARILDYGPMGDVLIMDCIVVIRILFIVCILI